jgi:hypothetical protein
MARKQNPAERGNTFSAYDLEALPVYAKMSSIGGAILKDTLSSLS